MLHKHLGTDKGMPIVTSYSILVFAFEEATRPSDAIVRSEATHYTKAIPFMMLIRRPFSLS